MAGWPPKKNDSGGFELIFPIYDADGDLVSGAASLDSEVSIDHGAFTDCTNEATEIATSSGVYYLALTQAEINGDRIATITKTSTSGAKTAVNAFYTSVRQIDDLAPEAGGNLATVLSEIQHATYGLAAIETLVDDLESRLTAARAGYLDELAAANIPADIDTLLSRLTALRAGYLDNLSAGAAALEATLTQMKETAAGGFDRDTDSLQAIRDRGDVAWITGGGGGITDIIEVGPLVPTSIDLGDTATVRLGLTLRNAIGDLPSTAEMTPGTISIDRKPVGGTEWTSIVSDAACSEEAGLIYYDEVFDASSGYLEGDTIRITFKSQKVTVSGTDYEISGSEGWIFTTYIRETRREHISLG